MSSNENANSSTLKSYIDSGAATIKSGIASLTGNTGDQIDAETTKAKADAEHDASHAAVKAGPFTVSSTGAPVKDNADRTDGQWNQTIGSVKEAAGNLIGNQSLKQSGREQNEQGQAQEAKGQLSDLGQGISDRLTGTVGGVIAAATGDRAGQEKFAEQHDEGKSRQRGVELDLQKQVEAAEQKPQ